MRLPPAPGVAALVGALLLALGVVAFLKGPRGWQPVGAVPTLQSPSHLVGVEGAGAWAAQIDAGAGGTLVLAARSASPYRVEVGGRRVLPQAGEALSAVQRVEVEVGPGRERIEVTLLPPLAEIPTRFDLLWALPPGGGTLLPAGGEAARPRPLTGAEEVFTLIWQGRGVIVAFFLALLLLIRVGIRLPRMRGE